MPAPVSTEADPRVPSSGVRELRTPRFCKLGEGGNLDTFKEKPKRTFQENKVTNS